MFGNIWGSHQAVRLHPQFPKFLPITQNTQSLQQEQDYIIIPVTQEKIKLDKDGHQSTLFSPDQEDRLQRKETRRGLLPAVYMAMGGDGGPGLWE